MVGGSGGRGGGVERNRRFHPQRGRDRHDQRGHPVTVRSVGARAAHRRSLPALLRVHPLLGDGQQAELWLRLPSAIAIAVAAGFLVELGRRLHSTRAGVTAAALFALLPSVSYYGAFARSYSFAAAAVVVSFWALHRTVESPAARRWVLYGASVALVCCTHLFAVLSCRATAGRRGSAAAPDAAAADAARPRRRRCARPGTGLGGVRRAARDQLDPQRGPEVLLNSRRWRRARPSPGCCCSPWR